MKKVVIFLSIIIFILVINKEEVIIPNESIRFRVIANSNDDQDQKLKKEIVDNLFKEIINDDVNNIAEERKFLKKKLPEFTKIVERTINNKNTTEKYTINYGKNYFPEKKYKGVIYPEGEYESLVITIGEGQGENFWCVLFPPLCLIDEEEVEYPSLIRQIISKYF